MPNTEQRRKVRVFIVDDHPLVREHLAARLQHEADLEVCGEAADALTVWSLISRHKPDLMILDISLKGSSGLDLLKEIRETLPLLPVLVLSMHDEPFYAEQALRAGAMGYITKEEAPVEILSAVRGVLGGQTYLSERMGGRLIHNPIGKARPIAEEVQT